MVFQKTLSSNSTQSNWNQVNDLAREVRSKDVTQIFKDDVDSTRRVLLGKGADGFYGLKVSPAGVDVYTATDDELIFNSNQNIFKIADTLESNIITDDVTSNNTQVQTNLVTQIEHGLDYIPAPIAYVQFPSSTYYCLMPYTTMDIFGSTINNYAVRTYSVTANATYINIILQVTQVTTTNQTIAYGGEAVKIYLLQETAN